MKKITIGKQCSYCDAWNYLNIVGYKPGQAFKTHTRCKCGNYIRWTEANMKINKNNA